jgi:hypothetical protein
MVLEIARQLARGGQREAELVRELAHASLAFAADLGEEADMSPAERRIAAHELEQLCGRPPPRPQPAHHTAQQPAQFGQAIIIGYHRITIIGSEGEEVKIPMCGSHGHRRGRRGFPDREQLVERLQRYQEHLAGEQKKVEELLARLVDAPAQPEPSI